MCFTRSVSSNLSTAALNGHYVMLCANQAQTHQLCSCPSFNMRLFTFSVDMFDRLCLAQCAKFTGTTVFKFRGQLTRS